MEDTEDKKDGETLVSVGLVITGDALDPKDVTDALGIIADFSWKKGDITLIGKNKIKHIYPWGGWKLYKTVHGPSEIENAILEFCSYLPKLENKLDPKNGVNRSIVVEVFGVGESDFEFRINRKMLEKLGTVPIEVSCHFG